ncbi:MAG: glycerophosphodiester phosphodiesterase [Clostridia bacterium]|nr:glycerophosphodiester phosphodiesterase [Clostridia bacterium]
MNIKKRIAIGLVCVLSVALLAGGVLFMTVMICREQLPQGFTYTAHTGCVDTADNSLEAIDMGVQHGAQIVEFDLHFTADGTPVLSHDAPTGGEVLLDEAFERVSRYEDLRVNVDVKIGTALEKVVSLAEKHGIKDRIFFTGLFEDDVSLVQKACPGIPYWLNENVLPAEEHTDAYLQELVDLVRACGAVGINMHKNNATKELVELFHANGLGVSLWTVNDTDEMLRCMALSPDNITTRRPDIMKTLLK